MTARSPAWRILLLSGLGLWIAAPFAQQPPVFQSNVRLVQTTVLVRDKDGRPVRDLTAADFKVFEDGKEQSIQVFSVETDPPSSAAAPTPAPSGSTGVFTNQLADHVTGGVTVIVLDRLNTSFEDQTSARDQIVEFLARIQPTDHVALYVLESDVVRVLHDFTTDAGSLVRVLARYVGSTSIELAGSDTSVPDFPRIGLADEDAKTEAWLTHTMEMVSATYLRRRAQLTTAALENIAHHLAGIRGRKNLVWVSSAFPLVFKDELGFTQVVNREVTGATRALNTADLAVYPVDARGLIGAFANPVAANAPYSGKAPPPVFTTMATTHPNQDTMRTVAENTGGRAYFNTNAIGDAVRRAIDDSRVSYVIGYYPARANWDGKFREISVKVNRRGLDVRHRKGYLALPPPARTDAKARAAGLVDALRNPLEATTIGLSAVIDREAGRPASEANLVVRVDASALTWERREVMREGAIDILVAESTPGGQFYTIKETTVNLNADPDQYAQMMREGFTLTVKVVLRDNADRLHVVVGDVTTQALGSLIIPADQVGTGKK